MSLTHAHPGFVTRSRSRSSAGNFVPSEDQIATARHRMICTLDKHDGSTPVRSLEDVVDFFCGEVTNRGNELGTYAAKQFKKTIQTALNGLMDDGMMLLESDEDEVLRIMLTEKAPVVRKHKRRKHNQKYPSRRSFAVA